jgi:formate-dependent nitrite reductase membrane component NrfD
MGYQFFECRGEVIRKTQIVRGLNDPNSRLRELLNDRLYRTKKPDAGTGPQIYYLLWGECNEDHWVGVPDHHLSLPGRPVGWALLRFCCRDISAGTRWRYSVQQGGTVWGLVGARPVMLGCALLIFDLGRWYKFWKLFVHFRWMSPMSIGSWLLVAFYPGCSSLSLFLAYLWAAWLDILEATRPPRFSAEAEPGYFAIPAEDRLLGGPISIGVGIYTGVLLGAVQSRPFWNTNLVAQLFLFSALSTGCAAVILVLAWKREAADSGAFQMLYMVDICQLTLEFFIVVPYLIHGQLSVQAVKDSLALILGGPFTVAFWVFFLGLGLLVPLGIEIFEAAPALLSKSTVHYTRWLAATTAVLVLGGGFLLCYIFVFAGQMSAFKWQETARAAERIDHEKS